MLTLMCRGAACLLFVVLCCQGLGLDALAAQVNGPLPLPLPLFPPDNWWNTDISSAPVDPQSAALIDFIGSDRGMHPDFGGNAPSAPEIYGLPYISVPGSQPLVPVTFVEFGNESDPGAPGRPPGYPIPEAAKFENRWIEGGHPGAAQVGGDRHMLLVDRDQRILFELYHVFWNALANRWEAGSGAVFPLDENRRRPDGWTSADAAGLAILPGLVRYDEVFGSEPIRHAFRVTVRATNGYVYPASHRAGDRLGAPPLGTRLRLRSGVDLTGYPTALRKIFQAMKTYGLIVADNGSDLYVTGVWDTRWDNDVLNPAFASITAGDFDVIELGWQPESVGPSDCTATAKALCLLGERFRVEALWQTPTGFGTASTLPLTADTGAFWFFDPANLELVTKLLDGCAINGRHWVFAAGLTNVGVELRVTDTATGQVRTFRSDPGPAYRPIQDTDAFSCP